jgi:hypothetical protein
VSVLSDHHGRGYVWRRGASRGATGKSDLHARDRRKARRQNSKRVDCKRLLADCLGKGETDHSIERESAIESVEHASHRTQGVP